MSKRGTRFERMTGLPDPGIRETIKPPPEMLTVFCWFCMEDLWRIPIECLKTRKLGPADVLFLPDGERDERFLQTNCPYCGEEVFWHNYGGGLRTQTREKGEFPRANTDPGLALVDPGCFRVRSIRRQMADQRRAQ